MDKDPLFIVSLIIDALVIIWIVLRERYIVRLNNDYIKEVERLKQSIEKSKSVIRGKISEEFTPLFPNFPYNMSDCKFFGQPIDYLVFENMSDIRDSNAEKDITIVFADVKSGNARNNKIQNKIKDAVQNGRIRFENWNVKDNKLEIK